MTERMAQFIVAALMVITSAFLFVMALTHGDGSDVWGATIIGAVLAAGAVILAQDRPSPR